MLPLYALGAAFVGWLAWEPQRPPTARYALGADPWGPIIARIVDHEASGRWDAVNANPRRPGVAYGPGQWTQTSGHLGRVLAAMRAADPRTFDAVTAPYTQQLLDVTGRGAMEPVGPYPLYHGWWTDRLVALARHPPFRAVMEHELRTGIHAQQAYKAAALVQLLSQRGLALAFDQSIRQGEYGIVQVARALADSWGGRPPGYAQRLSQFAAALNARSGAEDVQRRIAAILSAPELTDQALAVA